MDIKDFDFNLPENLIAQFPAKKRDESKLLLVVRETGKIKDFIFKDLPSILSKDDFLVFNNTRVKPLRLIGKRENGKEINILLVKEIEKNKWSFLVKKPKSLKTGEKIYFGKNFHGTIEGWADREHRVISFKEGILNKILEKMGLPPLPPYIKRENPFKFRDEDLKRYQTIFAKKGLSIAAPTAGLHFSDYILKKLKDKGIGMAEITLNVGEATFQPVRVERIEEHKMKYEDYEISNSEAEKINKAIREGKRIIAVGTTSVRTLESAYENGKILPKKASTNLFIYPGYKFKVVNAILTNFHLPKSTLFMLVSAFAGLKLMKKSYNYAINKGYRFFSYGDAMLIL